MNAKHTPGRLCDECEGFCLMPANNETPTRNYFGHVRAVCFICDRRSRPVKPDSFGEPDLFAMARGWSQAPFPADYQHPDGSVGSTYTCPACNSRLHKGETLAMPARRSKAAATIRSAA